MKFPNQIKLEQDKTHRLIPYRFSDRGKRVLDRVTDGDDDVLRDLTELEGATNDRLLAESGRLPGISPLELVSGFRLAHVVNASFTHGNPAGRFNNKARRAWYAGFELETAQKEVAFHRAAELKEVGKGWKDEEVSPYIDYCADFRHEFHDIRDDHDFLDCLDPDTNSYAIPQALGHNLLTSGSAGIVYPSVRHNDGVCIACFRPPLVLNVQEGPKVTFIFINAEMTSCFTEDEFSQSSGSQLTTPPESIRTKGSATLSH